MRKKIKSVSWDHLFIEKVGQNILITVGGKTASLEREQAEEMILCLLLACREEQMDSVC